MKKTIKRIYPHHDDPPFFLSCYFCCGDPAEFMAEITGHETVWNVPLCGRCVGLTIAEIKETL